MKRIKINRTKRDKTPEQHEDPLEAMIRRRRDFFLSLLDRITDPVSEELREEMRVFSRSQASEKGILEAIDCTADELRQLLNFLLEAPNLPTTNLYKTIRQFLETLRIQDELQIAPDAIVDYNTGIWSRLSRYARDRLTVYLPGAAAQTDTPLDIVERDIDRMFDTNNLFYPLFHSFIPEVAIKTFLAARHEETADVRNSIDRFLREHAFDLLAEAFDQGFEPKSNQDWEAVLPPEYFAQFPPGLWRLRTRDELEDMMEKMRKYSLSINDFIHLYRSERSKLVALGEQKKKTRSLRSIREDRNNILRLHNARKTELLERIRPDVDGLVSVLIEPTDGDDAYTGARYKGTGYFFPSDAFYRDLARYGAEQPGEVLTITSTAFDPPRARRLRVFHLLQDGRILPQTRSAFLRSRALIEEDSAALSIPHIREHLLNTPLLAPPDLDFARNTIRKKMSVFLSLALEDNLNIDAITDEIESSMWKQSGTLGKYLEKAFAVFFLIDPRYGLKRLFPGIDERLKMFVYRLDALGDLPIEFAFPRYVLLEKRDLFDKWLSQSRDIFAYEVVSQLLQINYPFLRATSRARSPDPYTPVFIPSAIESYTLLVPYNGRFLSIADVAQSIAEEEELFVDGKALSPRFISTFSSSFDIGRAGNGYAAILMPSGFELPDAEDGGAGVADLPIDVIPDITAANLPDFRATAFAFLDRL